MLDNVYLKGVNYHKNTTPVHDLKDNFDKILPIVNGTLHDQLNKAQNLQFYSHKPSWPDTYIITLPCCKRPWALAANDGCGVSLKRITPPTFPACRIARAITIAVSVWQAGLNG